jgi:cytochrome c oxidase assembly protein subunit 15
MDPKTATPGRPAPPSPALAAFAVAAAAWAFVPVALGAFTTSINAGMAFPDWPLSNGSLNPAGWLTNLAMFAEHSHRLSVGLLSLATIGLAAWIAARETRVWLKKLGWFAVGLVLAQAVVGGLRVLLEPDRVASLDTSVGQLLAMLHACLAQLFVCTLIAVATACSSSWVRRPVPVSPGLRTTGAICCVLLFVQLAIAAVMRHSFAGLAIPTFPWSTPDGRILPAAWDFRVGINFAHRSMAAVLAVALTVFAFRLWFDRGSWLRMRCGASALISLLALQILLGAAVIRTARDPLITTCHVVVGALTLATTFWLTWLAHRDTVEAAR